MGLFDNQQQRLEQLLVSLTKLLVRNLVVGQELLKPGLLKSLLAGSNRSAK